MQTTGIAYENRCRINRRLFDRRRLRRIGIAQEVRGRGRQHRNRCDHGTVGCEPARAGARPPVSDHHRQYDKEAETRHDDAEPGAARGGQTVEGGARQISVCRPAKGTELAGIGSPWQKNGENGKQAADTGDCNREPLGGSDRSKPLIGVELDAYRRIGAIRQ